MQTVSPRLHVCRLDVVDKKVLVLSVIGEGLELTNSPTTLNHPFYTKQDLANDATPSRNDLCSNLYMSSSVRTERLRTLRPMVSAIRPRITACYTVQL